MGRLLAWPCLQCPIESGLPLKDLTNVTAIDRSIEKPRIGALERGPESIRGDVIDVLTIDCSLTGVVEGFDALVANLADFFL